MSDPNLDYRKIRRLTEARLKDEKLRTRLSFLAASAFALVLFAVIAWGLLLSRSVSPDRDAYAVGLGLLTVAGLLGMLAQSMSILLDTKGSERKLRERLYDQVLKEQMMGLGEEDEDLLEKPKHITRLTDDGELEEVRDDEDYAAIERKTQRR